MELTPDYFIDKFQAIPEEKWCMLDFENKNGQKCALGHCGMHHGNLSAVRLIGLLGAVNRINDGQDPRYKQVTPKQRILAALRDIRDLPCIFPG